MTKRACLLAAGALFFAAMPATAVAQGAPTELTAEEAAVVTQIEALEKSLHPQFGRIAIPEAKATLDLGENYYFLPAAEARRVLTEAWGNPPDASVGVLGMVFPAGKSFYDATWGAVIQYEDTGHISDHDAAEQDYDSVLADMKAAAEEENEAVVAQGYPASHIIGWAQAPTYDSASKTLIWARNIQFEGNDQNTLNYDVRKLGRTGVLSLNMVDTMSNLAQVRSAAEGLSAVASFDAGARYADYNASTDRTAEYGLAGLVAAGAGLGVAKKAGIFAILAIIFKKGFAFILAALAGAGVWLKRRFGGGHREGAGEEE